jgi:hypothetical protein
MGNDAKISYVGAIHVRSVRDSRQSSVALTRRGADIKKGLG